MRSWVTARLGHRKGGIYDPVTIDSGAPLKGANSFTEAQAKDRAIAAGYTDVTGLAKDSNGIWRGKSVNIAIDFKGNIVSN